MEGMIHALQPEIWVYVAIFVAAAVVYNGALLFVNSVIPLRGSAADKEDARVVRRMFRDVTLYIFLLSLVLAAIARAVPHFSS